MPRDATVIHLHRPTPSPVFELGAWVKDRSGEKGEIIGINHHPISGHPHGYFVRQSLLSVYRYPHELEITTVPKEAAARMDGPILLTEEAPPRASWWRRDRGTMFGSALLLSFVVLGVVSAVRWG